MKTIESQLKLEMAGQLAVILRRCESLMESGTSLPPPLGELYVPIKTTLGKCNALLKASQFNSSDMPEPTDADVAAMQSKALAKYAELMDKHIGSVPDDYLDVRDQIQMAKNLIEDCWFQRGVMTQGTGQTWQMAHIYLACHELGIEV